MKKNSKVFMWYKVNELFNKEKLNKSQIARELEIYRGTVSKYLKMDEQTFLTWCNTPRNLPKKLESYSTYVKNTLEELPYLSASQIEDRLKENFPDSPLVDSKTVYNFVKSIRDKYDIPKVEDSSIRKYNMLPEVEYGSEAQVDFGESYMHTSNDRRVKVYFFAIVLCRSRQKFIYFQNIPFTTETAIYAHELAFEYFEGIPKVIIYDQDSVFIKDENLGDYLLTEKFTTFCNNYPFEHVFCRKADPESKGKVENVVKYVKQNFVRGREYITMEELNSQGISWLKRTGNYKKNGTTHKRPIEEWKIEKEHLQPYMERPNKPFVSLPKYFVRKDNTVAYKGNFYSLPYGTYTSSDTSVLLSNNGDTLTIYNLENQVLTSHILPLGKGNHVYKTDHMRSKSKSLREREELMVNELGGSELAQEYLTQLEKDKPRYFNDNLRYLEKHLYNYKMSYRLITLEFCISNNILNASEFIDILKYHSNDSNSETLFLSTVEDTLDRLGYNEMSPKTSEIDFYENIL